MRDASVESSPHPASRVPHPASLIPHPSSLIPHPSSLIPHPSSLIPPLVLVVHHVGSRVAAADTFRCRTIGRVPGKRVRNRILNIGRPKQLGAQILADMLGFRIVVARSVAEQKALVYLFVDEV